MAKLGFCRACATETETSRREAGFPRVFLAYKPIYMDCTLLHNGGRSTVWYAYPKEERALILHDPRLFNLGPPARLATCAERRRRNVYSGFNTVFLSLLLLAAGVGFPAACFWR